MKIFTLFHFDDDLPIYFTLDMRPIKGDRIRWKGKSYIVECCEFQVEDDFSFVLNVFLSKI